MSRTCALRPDLLAHASGALWCPPYRMLFVADLHLGYGWAQRRKGELGPLADQQAVKKLNEVSEELRPATIIFVGDIVHAPRPCAEERDYIEATLRSLGSGAELVSVQGNHDRAFQREFATLPVRVVKEFAVGELLAIHGDKLPVMVPEGKTVILGHLHPSMPVKDVAGAGRRLPVFLSTASAVLLPAFSPFAAGYNLLEGLPDEFARCMGQGPVLAHVVSGTRVVPVGPIADAIERMYRADVGKAEVFRRFRK